MLTRLAGCNDPSESTGPHIGKESALKDMDRLTIEKHAAGNHDDGFPRRVRRGQPGVDESLFWALRGYTNTRSL